MSNLIERQHLDPEEGDALVIPKSFRHRDMTNALLTLATPTWLTSSWGTSPVTPQRTVPPLRSRTPFDRSLTQPPPLENDRLAQDR